MLTRREIAGLRSQLSQLERDTGAQPKGDLQVATEKVPKVSLEYLRRYRDVKYYETIFELVAQQFEMAKMDQARDTAAIQVLDAAIPPEKKSRPQRLSMVLMGIFGTALTAMLVAILRELPLLSPGQQAQWSQVKSYLAAR